MQSLELAVRRDVPLRDELRFLGAYLEIQQRRFGPRRHPVHESMGLTNTRLRLHQLPDGDFDFAFTPRAGGGSRASIAIPFAAASVASQHEAATYAGVSDISVHPQSSRGRIALQMVVGWAIVPMLWTELDTASRIGMHRPVAWSLSLLASVINATIWAALVAPIVAMARRFDLTNGWSPANILAHAAAAAAAVAAAALHVSLYLGVLRTVVPAAYPIERANAYSWALWDLAAYAAILAFATVVTLGARPRESLARIAITRARLVQARVDSLRMHLQPGVLLAGLGAIEQSMMLDPTAAERAITRMGDLLRLLLARGNRDTVSLGSEIAALRAHLDVMGGTASVDADESLYSATLPSVLLTPLAASFGGVTPVQVAVRHRLTACLGTRWTLATRCESGAAIVLRVPLVGHAERNIPDASDAVRELIA